MVARTRLSVTSYVHGRSCCYRYTLWSKPEMCPLLQNVFPAACRVTVTSRLILYVKIVADYSENCTKQILVLGLGKMYSFWMTKQVVHVETIALYHVFRLARILAESFHYVRNVFHVWALLLHRDFREIWYWQPPYQFVDRIQILLKSGKT